MRYLTLVLVLLLGACQVSRPETNRIPAPKQASYGDCVADQARADARLTQAKQAGVLSIRDDRGGCIHTYTYLVDALPRSTHIEIAGVCGSACTLFLGHPGVCAQPGAIFEFHGPSDRGKPLSETAFRATSESMARYYPEPVRSRFMARYRYQFRDHESVPVRANMLIAEGVLSAC